MDLNISRYLYILAFGLFLTRAVMAQGSWELVDMPTDNHLRSVYFTDSLYGWVVGDTGTILHTRDGGNTWIEQDAGTEDDVMFVYFLDRQQGWAVSWSLEGFFGTFLLRTVDGGETWIIDPYPEEFIFINCILFTDPQHGWMGGSPHALVHTQDGGQSWQQASIDTSAIAFFPVLDIAFWDDSYGYAAGGMFDIAGVTWSTSDGGEHWTPIANAEAPADEVHGLHLFDSVNVLGAGGDPDQGYGVGMLRTADGGAHWEYDELSMAGNAFDIDFRNATEAWAPLGPQQKLIYSLDAGQTWTTVDAPGSSAIFDIAFPDSLHGYGVGYHGAFIRYIPPPVGIWGKDNFTLPEINIYPNPAENVVVLEWSLGEGDQETLRPEELRIYDLQFRDLQPLAFDVMDAERNMVRLDVSALEAGVYIIKITFRGRNSGVVTKKLLIR